MGVVRVVRVMRMVRKFTIHPVTVAKGKNCLCKVKTLKDVLNGSK